MFAVSHLHLHSVATYASGDKQHAFHRNPTVQIQKNEIHGVLLISILVVRKKTCGPCDTSEEIPLLSHSHCLK